MTLRPSAIRSRNALLISSPPLSTHRAEIVRHVGRHDRAVRVPGVAIMLRQIDRDARSPSSSASSSNAVARFGVGLVPDRRAHEGKARRRAASSRLATGAEIAARRIGRVSGSSAIVAGDARRASARCPRASARTAPTWSSVRDSSSAPAREIRPWLGLMREHAAERRRADHRAVGLRADARAAPCRRRPPPPSRTTSRPACARDRADCASCRDGNRRIRWSPSCR